MRDRPIRQPVNSEDNEDNKPTYGILNLSNHYISRTVILAALKISTKGIQGQNEIELRLLPIKTKQNKN